MTLMHDILRRKKALLARVTTLSESAQPSQDSTALEAIKLMIDGFPPSMLDRNISVLEDQVDIIERKMPLRKKTKPGRSCDAFCKDEDKTDKEGKED